MSDLSDFIGVRLTKKDNALLKHHSAQTDLTPSEIIRQLISTLRNPNMSNPTEELVKSIVKQLTTPRAAGRTDFEESGLKEKFNEALAARCARLVEQKMKDLAPTLLDKPTKGIKTTDLVRKDKNRKQFKVPGGVVDKATVAVSQVLSGMKKAKKRRQLTNMKNDLSTDGIMGSNKKQGEKL